MGTNTRCWIHEAIEPTAEGSTICFECKHAYLNDEAIKLAFIEMWADMYNMTVDEARKDLQKRNKLDIDSITYCPLCLHDW